MSLFNLLERAVSDPELRRDPLTVLGLLAEEVSLELEGDSFEKRAYLSGFFEYYRDTTECTSEGLYQVAMSVRDDRWQCATNRNRFMFQLSRRGERKGRVRPRKPTPIRTT